MKLKELYNYCEHHKDKAYKEVEVMVNGKIEK